MSEFYDGILVLSLPGTFWTTRLDRLEVEWFQELEIGSPVLVADRSDMSARVELVREILPGWGIRTGSGDYTDYRKGILSDRFLFPAYQGVRALHPEDVLEWRVEYPGVRTPLSRPELDPEIIDSGSCIHDVLLFKGDNEEEHYLQRKGELSDWIESQSVSGNNPPWMDQLRVGDLVMVLQEQSRRSKVGLVEEAKWRTATVDGKEYKWGRHGDDVLAMVPATMKGVKPGDVFDIEFRVSIERLREIEREIEREEQELENPALEGEL